MTDARLEPPSVPTSTSRESAERYVRVTSESLGLAIPEANLSGVVAFYLLARSMAEQIDRFALDDHEDPAPMYWPGAPR